MSAITFVVTADVAAAIFTSGRRKLDLVFFRLLSFLIVLTHSVSAVSGNKREKTEVFSLALGLSCPLGQKGIIIPYMNLL